MLRSILAALFRRPAAAPSPQPQPAAPKPSRPARPRHRVIMTDTNARPARTASRNSDHPGKLYCPDRLALIAFDDRARLVAPFMDAFDARFASAVQDLPGQVRGSITNIAAALSMANDLIADQHPGLLRRIWLLSDGHPNPRNQPIAQEVGRAISQRTNLNTIGIGQPGDFDRALLERIAGRTHNGRFAEAQTVTELNRAFKGAEQRRQPGSHRGEATVFVVDVSGSMLSPMGSDRRIDAVRDAMLGLLRYKQARWA